MKIGKIIKQARKAKGLTQLQLAKKLGYDSSQFVSLFERGLSKVPLKVLGRLAVILDLDSVKLSYVVIEDMKENVSYEVSQGVIFQMRKNQSAKGRLRLSLLKKEKGLV